MGIEKVGDFGGKSEDPVKNSISWINASIHLRDSNDSQARQAAAITFIGLDRDSRGHLPRAAGTVNDGDVADGLPS